MQCLAIAQRTLDPVQLSQAHTMLAHTECLSGHFSSAKAHVDEVETVYKRSQHTAHVQLSGLDPGVFSTTVSGWVQWFLGYPDQALERANRAIDLARELGHPQSLEHAFGSAAYALLLCRDIEQVKARAEDALTIARERGFAYRESMNRIVLAWVASMDGDKVSAVSEITAAIDDYRSMGGNAFLTYYLGLLAEVYGNAGQVGNGLSAVDEALELARSHEEYWWQPELLRRRGELLLSDGEISAAEASFEQALSAARAQLARSWELRAATSLARCWCARERYQEARELLGPVHGWFSEGAHLTDLQEANDLLTALA
jgi:predicted ATPase